LPSQTRTGAKNRDGIAARAYPYPTARKLCMRGGSPGLPAFSKECLTRPLVHPPQQSTTRRTPMLWTIFALLMVMWALGMVSSYTLGGFIHILLLLAIVAVLIRIIQGRNPV
jgi:hypothetical protein